MKMSVIDQANNKVTPVTPAAPAVPADMPRDNGGNIAYEHGNFFQSKTHSDGLPRPPHAHEPSSWASLLVDPDILSLPAPAWQQPGFRYGLINRLYVGPYFDLGYNGHCHACDGRFLKFEWAQEHKCTEEQAFRDVTRRFVRDYKTLRKAAKDAPAPLPKREKGILARLFGMFSGR
jgi:hypothetical protein